MASLVREGLIKDWYVYHNDSYESLILFHITVCFWVWISVGACDDHKKKTKKRMQSHEHENEHVK